MKLLTLDIEELIDNNMFFEKLEYHLCSLYKSQYIKYYFSKKNISLLELVDNTINRYLDDIIESKRRYLLEEPSKTLYSNKRYKNYISKEKLEKIKFQFMNSKLYYRDWVIVSLKNPVLELFYTFLNSVNHILYIINVQFKNNSVQLTNKNYKDKTSKDKEDAENLMDENMLIDSKIREGLIDLKIENDIEGSAVISSITNRIVPKIKHLIDFDIFEEFNEEDIEILDRNSNFQKRYVKVNFTEKEMVNGFAQVCYNNYAHSSEKEFKSLRNKYINNHSIFIPDFPHDIIANKIIDLFNTLLDNETDKVKSIRQSPDLGKVLKIYDNIYIYTTKNLNTLDDKFYNFVLENFIDKTEKIENFINENEKEFKELIKQLRIIFY